MSVALWGSLALVAYAYMVYPGLIHLAAKAFGRAPTAPVIDDGQLPTVSLVLAAFNEVAVLADRLSDALAMDYPPGRLEILVGSDGSTDGTAGVARAFEGRGVRLLDFPVNRGKASVLNDAVAAASGEILLMSDANTRVEPGAARCLARWFADPEVGAVVGRLVLVDPASGKNADGLYWRYETFLKTREARLGALLGANGAIYAIRRSLYEPIPAGTIVDDFVIPLLATQRTGCRLVYDRGAVAVEETAPGVGAEFRRRARIGAGGYQSIGMLWRLLDPRRGWLAFAFWSHKVLRWLGPFFLLGALAANLALAGRPFYRGMLAAQGGFYLLAGLLPLVPSRVTLARPLRLATMFVGMNAALLVGFCRWLLGRQKGTWARTERSAAGVGR